MTVGDLTAALQSLSPVLLPANIAHEPQHMLAHFASRRLKEADRADAAAWEKVHSREDWQTFVAPRLAALRESLGSLPTEVPRVELKTSTELKDDRFKIQNIVYISREGDPVSANLYVPDPIPAKIPGILICHAHHNPKTHKELQDMGMNWARSGCYVLIPDMLGHGERRHQPFEGRQEYYFRYSLGMQLHLAGESLIGRFVWDLWRGVDVLLKQPRIDASRIILLGAVAGGGDPAAVAAALDSRITCVVPFNFGGPQPETAIASQTQAQSFSFTGSGGFESTRNLRLSARDGFLPWVITGGAIPRHLIYAHEFEWNGEVDPIWQRYQKLYGWNQAPERLASVSGKGHVSQSADVATHCNQIGPPHLKQIYPAFKRWFNIAIPDEAALERRNAAELQCMAGITRTPAHEQIRASAQRKIEAVRAELAKAPLETSRALLRERYGRVLLLPPTQSFLTQDCGKEEAGPCTILKRVLVTEPDIFLPLVILIPKQNQPAPVVIALTQEGKARVLKERAAEIAQLLAKGIAVCVPDLRGCGETDPDSDRSWFGQATAHSSSELMLGRTQLGNRLHDLFAVQSFLRELKELDCERLALWGDSFAPINPPNFADPPLRTQPAAAIGEPAAGLLALLGALFDQNVRAVYARRTLQSWLSVFDTPFVHLPHDVIVPGIIEAGDISDLAEALTPCVVEMADPIDGRNISLSSETAADPVTWLTKTLRS